MGVDAEVADRLVAAGPRPISPNPVTTVRGGLEIGRAPRDKDGPALSGDDCSSVRQ